MLAENVVDLKQCEALIDWCASILDRGLMGTVESSIIKVAVSETLMRVADHDGRHRRVQRYHRRIGLERTLMGSIPKTNYTVLQMLRAREE